MKKLLLCLACLGTLAVAQQTPSFNLIVTGEKTWTIRLGFGAAGLLSPEGLSPGQPALTQTLRAEIEGKALDFLTLRASFNDQLGPGFQEFIITADRPPWKGELGRFMVGAEGEGLGVYNKRVLGIRAEYMEEYVQGTFLAARMEGISESRTFRGAQRVGETQFSATAGADTWQPAPYLSSVEGLAFWNLRKGFVEGLTQVRVRLSDSPGLWSLLASSGLAFLQEDLRAELEVSLAEGEYLPLRDGADVLALRVSLRVLARKRIQDAIEAHNTRLDLTGSARRTYPFIEDTELEGQFLSALMDHFALLVDDDTYAFANAQMRRYLPLGERDIIEGTVNILIRRSGDTEYLPADDPALSAYRWALLALEGVLRIDFPEDFFIDGALRVRYAFRQEGGAFALGLSLVPGSERAFRNGQLLIRGTDYSLDYEVGMLILFAPLGPEDELRVDFERQRGALGVTTEYERGFFGFTLGVPGWDGFRLSVYRAADFGSPTVTTRTMPNTHTVFGVALKGAMGDWAYRLNLGGSENIFPPGDNARAPMPNRINAISAAAAPDGEYVVFAHQNGLTVYKDGLFSNYGGAQGLLGRAVLCVLATPGRLLVGTDAGLTVVRLAESAPFDRVRSWVRLHPDMWNRDRAEDRFEGRSVLAASLGGGRVYLATEKELVAFALGDAEDPTRWSRIPLPHEGFRPTALLATATVVFVGSDQGLLVWNGATWDDLGEQPQHVYALRMRGETVYVASDQGVRMLRMQVGSGWLVYGKPVYALAFHEGAMWFASDDGLWREGDVHPEVSGLITAAGVAAGSIWAGGEADPSEEFALDLWRIADRPQLFEPRTTKIDGRDSGRFQDIIPAEHTRIGVAGSVVLQRSIGQWNWELTASSLLPGYAEIGRGAGSEAHAVSVSGRYSAGSSLLDIHAKWDLAEASTRPMSRLSGGLDWRWTGRPSLSLAISPTAIGSSLTALDRVDAEWRAGVSDKSGSVTWSLSASGVARYPDLSLSGQAVASVSLQPLEGWTVDGKWTRPFQTRGTPGQETFTVSAKWNLSARAVTGTATGQSLIRHHLTTGIWRDEHSARLDLRWTPRLIHGTDFAPRLSASWRSNSGEWRWDTRLDGDLSRSPFSMKIGGTIAQGFRASTERSDRSLTLSVTWEHSGWEGVRPSLSWNRSWTILSHPRYPDQITDNEDASLRVTWEPPAASWRNVSSLTWRSRDKSVSLTNRLLWPLQTGSLTASLEATLRDNTVEARISSRATLPLDALLTPAGIKPVGDAWAVNAEAGYVIRQPLGSPGSQSFFVGMTVAVRF